LTRTARKPTLEDVGDERTSAGKAGDEAAIAAKRKAAAYVGQVLAERYRVEELVALGGMGAVFRAEHVHLRKEVALKLLHPSTENLPELVTRFERESIVGAHVTHPNVCQATDFGKLDDGAHYLVLEYVRGHTLQQILRREGALDPTKAARIALQIAAGLEAAHEIGIVHRDVKPANVMVSDGPEAHVKIVDFGLAKLPPDRFHIDEKLSITTTGTVFGTVAYMAPELARGMIAVDHRSDLYALGVMLYEMLAGKRPFEAQDTVTLFQHHVKTDPPRIADRVPGREVPPALEAIARKLLEKAPGARYQGASEVVSALAEACPAAIPPPQPSHTSSARLAAQALVLRDVGPPSDASPQPASLAAPEKRGSRGGLWLIGVAAVAAVVVFALRSFVPGLGARAASAPPATSAGPVPPTDAVPSASVAPRAPPAAAASAPALTSEARAAAAAAALLTPEAIRQRAAMNDAAAAHNAKRSAAALFALAKIAPDAFAQSQDLVAETAAVAGTAALDPAMAGDVFALLSGPALGTGGPDVLLYLSTHYGGSRAATHANQLLADPGVLGRASPGLRMARDLKMAPCRDRPALYDRGVAEGDERTLVLLTAMLKPDCSEATGGCCAQADTKLAAAVAKLRQRLHK
jgi:serine/threonine-protein kinase